MQVTWRGFGTIKKNSKQAQTEGEKLSTKKNRRWATQKPQLWRQKEEREEGEKEERRRNRSRRWRWKPWLSICAGLLACCFNFAQPLLCHLLLLNLFFFPHKSSSSRSKKSPKCIPAKSLISAGICWKKKKKGTVRTARIVHGSQNRKVRPQFTWVLAFFL